MEVVKSLKMRRAAYDFGRAMVWGKVADSYLDIFNLAIS